MHVVHLTSSRFFGGPERQMLELARELAPQVSSSFCSFSEGNLCQDFLEEASAAGFPAVALTNDTPRLVAAARELKTLLTERKVSLLCVHGYKAGILGLLAARSCRIPIIAVSRGWTAENWKVRIYEKLDRLVLRKMDRVVCVSRGQAERVRQAGVPDDKIVVIHNAIRTERFNAPPQAEYRCRLEELFAHHPQFILGAAGRLSPEKGFDVLIDACQVLQQNDVDLGVVLFGEGSLRDALQAKIDAAGLGSQFVLAGFTAELDRFMPHFDLFVQSSHTEGLPNVLLEAAAAGVPVVATNVGGTSEVVVDKETGLVVPAGNPQQLASGILQLLLDDTMRTMMSTQSRRHVADNFTFTKQASAYSVLLHSLVTDSSPAITTVP